MGPAEIPEKRLATYRYSVWKAGRQGVPFKMPPRHPFNPLPWLRLILARGSATADIDAVFNAVWADGLDVADPAVVAEVAAGLEPMEHPEIDSDAVKQMLRANTDEAVGLGVYGVPTFAVADPAGGRRRLFWGQDAGDMLLDWLDDPALFQSPEMHRAETCGVAAERRR